MNNKQDENELKSSSLYRPGELYQETFNRILTAYIKAVEKCGGNPSVVTLNDIESVSDLNPNMLEMYYKNTTVIINEVIASLQAIIKAATKSIANYSQEGAIKNLLTLLSKKPLLIKAIKASGHKEFWYNNLKNILFLISEWDDADDEVWADVCGVFCYQFNQALDHWEKNEYSEDYIPTLTDHLCCWLELDGEFIRYVNNHQ